MAADLGRCERLGSEGGMCNSMLLIEPGHGPCMLPSAALVGSSCFEFQKSACAAHRSEEMVADAQADAAARFDYSGDAGRDDRASPSMGFRNGAPATVADIGCNEPDQ